MAPLSADELFMREALELARKGEGLASPNPMVGAVIVDERGRIVGRGTHTYEGRKHAEVLAIEEAGDKARGNTLYLNLEPCSHTGRTGPCADAVIAAGLHRVVCAMKDPNPLVAGQGFAKLRAAGIDVEVGIFEAEAKKLNEAFAKYIRTRTPLVVMKAGLSKDGNISPANKKPGAPFYLIGEESKARVQRMRHEMDAILIGIGTLLGDDPSLTDRSGLKRRRKLQRVVLDSKLRIPVDAKIVTSCDDDVIVFCVSGDEAKKQDLRARGVKIVEVAGAGNDKVDVREVLRRLGEMEITSLLVEGGAEVNASFLAAKAADKISVFVTPMVLEDGIGWSSGGETIDTLGLRDVREEKLGSDISIEGYLKDLYV